MCSVMMPPSSGPIASASAETPAQMPIAMPRSRTAKVAEMIESVAGIISAAPTPWTARAAISSPAPEESPRQGDVHDRVVEHDHEQREAERSERPPFLVLFREDPRAHRPPLVS